MATSLVSHPWGILIIALSLYCSVARQVTSSETAEQSETTSQPESPPTKLTLPPLVDDVVTETTGEPPHTTAQEDVPATSGAKPTPEQDQSTQRMVCADDNYCLNGGTCITNEGGQMICICPDGFYGVRCQTRNICRTVIADTLSGDQICAKIDRECVENDRFFRCFCKDDEYFVFKINNKEPSYLHSNRYDPHQKPNQNSIAYYENYGPLPTNQFYHGEPFYNPIHQSQTSESENDPDASRDSQESAYVAECRKIDKCLGVRCRRLSEVCSNGKCVCNQESGYSIDPRDGLCRLINRCLLPALDGTPICGQAQCVPTYDNELYRCVCPIGYKAVKKDEHKSSTQCVLLRDLVCEVPLLNKCQHYCYVDGNANSYKCTCMNGYRSGSNVGVDDHLCFFDDLVGLESGYGRGSRSSVEDSTGQTGHLKDHEHSFILHPIQAFDNPVSNGTYSPRILHVYHRSAPFKESDHQARLVDQDDDYSSPRSPVRLSSQERCNMYCEENKICALEKDSADSYRCVCERQGYVSVGDRCLNWCSAAEFSYKVRDFLEKVCLSGSCRPTSSKPCPSALRESSWRPAFECDCTNSPLLIQDPSTKLCKLNFEAVLEPCLPGNVGHTDCVLQKNAFCSVLFRPAWAFLRGLQSEFPDSLPAKDRDENADSVGSRSKIKSKDKLYTCVCSPEKKFLVDKPRNKARCIDECDLLNNECGRFNRMCRPATIAPEDFGRRNLVRLDPDGPRMDFRRTGCECLPGFNVGPYETVDFTLDDNYNQENQFGSRAPLGERVYPPALSNVLNNFVDQYDSDHPKIKYMNINSRCLLDFDVVEFRASFKAPSDFDPIWLPPNSAHGQADTMAPVLVDELRNSCRLNPTTGRKPNETGGDEGDQSSRSSRGSRMPRNEDCPRPPEDDYVLPTPDFMRADISELHKRVVLVANCESSLARLSLEAYKECIEYRYWIIQKLRNHFVDWRRVLSSHLSATFDLMEGNIRLHIDKCESRVESISPNAPNGQAGEHQKELLIDPAEQHSFVDADVDCWLTLRSANEGISPKLWRKVLLEKQLQKFIFVKEIQSVGPDYYLMAPNMLIRRKFVDQLAEYRHSFNPCESDYAYCDRYTRCDMVDIVNFTCTCETGYTPIGSRDIYFADSRKEVCEDINECLFDVCKDLANVSTCINEIGDYKCLCNRHYIGDNKKFCTHVCNTIPCIHGKCRLVDDHHAFCQCDEGYKETDCSVQDPNVALRKANMIICGSIFTSVLLLAVTFAINLNSQLKKTKKKLKRLENLQDASSMIELAHQQAFTPRLSKISN